MYTQRWRFHKILIFTATSRTFSVKLDSDAWEKKTVTLELGGPAFLVFPLQKTLTLWSYFSVRKLGVSRGNNSAQWLCPPRACVLFRDLKTIRSAGSHTQKGFVPLITLDIHLFLHIFMPSSSFLWAPLCARQGASPQQNTLRKTPLVPALLMLGVKTLASEISELDPHLMFKSPLKHYQPPQLLIKYLVSAHVGQVGTSSRFWGEGKKPPFEYSLPWSSVLGSCSKSDFKGRMDSSFSQESDEK